MGFTVIGARGKVPKVEDFIEALRITGGDRGIQIQAFVARMVFGRDHIASAYEHALRAFREGRNVASELMVEVMLYAAGERQITKALERMGVKRGRSEVVLLIAGETDVRGLLEDLGLERDDDLVKGDVALLPEFGISPSELETIPTERALDLVLERVALLDVIK